MLSIAITLAGIVIAAAGPQAPQAPKGASFDRGAASSALGTAAEAVQACKKPGGPTGPGKVKVTFGPMGTVTNSEVEGAPYAGTAVGGCVAGKFRGAHVPEFSGPPITVSKSFSIN